MDWDLLYRKHIEKCTNQNILEGEYYENHHIVPRYQGGGNELENLVRLTHPQHITAHYILWRLHNNVEDKIAYKMMQGQTLEGKMLIQKLAVNKSLEHGREYITELFKDKKRVNEIMKKRKETRCKNNNGNYYSQKSLDLLSQNTALRTLSNESINKRKKSHKETIANMTPEERSKKFGSHKEKHPFWGKERKGKKAANYGKTKGLYEIITPTKEVIYYKSLKEMMINGWSEKTIKTWRNEGIITKPKFGGKPSKWIGYEIKYTPNKKYGT